MSRYDRGVRWEEESLDVHGTRWVATYLPVWLYSYQQPGSGMLHYIAVNGRTGETMGSVLPENGGQVSKDQLHIPPVLSTNGVQGVTDLTKRVGLHRLHQRRENVLAVAGGVLEVG